MTKTHLAQEFDISLFTKGSVRSRREGKRIQETYTCAAGNIAFYIVGHASVNKVGVSEKPYERMHIHTKNVGVDLRMLFFAEMERGQGFELERRVKRHLKAEGRVLFGEWTDERAEAVYRYVQGQMVVMGITAVHEVGDCTDDRKRHEAALAFGGSKTMRNIAIFQPRKEIY